MTRRVLLLASKDTIAYRAGSVATGAGLLAAASRPADADVTVEDVLAEPGWDASPATMAATARRVRAALGEEGFHGVVVTHGTDTLEEAAYLTDLVAGAASNPATARGAIVFTGALLPLDAPGSDGPANLTAALVAAADPAAAGLGAVACFDGELHAAARVRQAAASRPGAFTSAPHEPLGRVLGGRVTLTAAPPPPPSPPGEPETNVALIKVYPGIGPALLTAATDAGARGVVLEGTGALNVPVPLLGAVADLVSWDIPVVVTSRARAGGAPRSPDGLAATVGAILAPDLTAGKAWAALMVALGAEGGVAAARDYFARL
ncbi:asparaginase domain-containing protein [Dactylosporangium sp. NPDC000244]|uniref:asparaginase n=1 Tax=Dactylosporangium sp. NPDC000244 TaxID=3154365 RepID=UPI003323F818